MVGPLRRVRKQSLLLARFTVFLRSDEGIGNLFKGVLNGLLVRQHLLLPVGAGEPELRTESPSLEDGLTYAKGCVPSFRGCCDELVQDVALESSQSSQRQVRKEGGLGDTDLGVSGDHDFLCLADVRPALQ